MQCTELIVQVNQKSWKGKVLQVRPLMEISILNIKMTNFFTLHHSVLPYLVIAYAKKWPNCIYIAITFEILVQNQ